MQETQFGDYAVTKQRRIIHFSSGETLEEKDSEEEEDQPSDSPFRESEQKVGHCSIDNHHATYTTHNILFLLLHFSLGSH